MATDFDFTEDTAASEVQDFEFQEEPAVPQLQFPTLPPGATLADFLSQQPPIMQPWEGGVVRSALPGSLQPEDLLPAVRKIGGELAVGEQGDTHPDIIEREGIPAVEIDQRGFMGPQGEFYDREAAAQGTGIPTEREPGRLHSTDLPAFESPVAITDKGPVYASDTGKPIPSTGEEPWTFGQVVSAPLKGAGMVIADILNRARMEGAGLPEVTAPQAIISPEGIRMETEEERKNRLSFGGEKPLYVPRGTALAPQGNELQRLISQWSTPESLALLPAGMSRAGAALVMTQMVPGILGEVKAVIAGEGTEEEKRDRINNLFSMAILAAHGAGKERPQAERAAAQVPEARPTEAVTPALEAAVPAQAPQAAIASELGAKFSKPMAGRDQYQVVHPDYGTITVVVPEGSGIEAVRSKIDAAVARFKEAEPTAPKAEVTAMNLLKMTPDQIVEWKKSGEYGEAKRLAMSKAVDPKDVPALEAERDRLRAEATKTLDSVADAGLEERLKAAENVGRIGLKAQLLNEMLMDAPKPAEAPKAASAPADKIEPKPAAKEPWQMTRKEFDKSDFYQHNILHPDRPSVGPEGFRSGIGPNVIGATSGKPLNIIEARYGTKAGRPVYVVPKDAIVSSPNGPKIKPGWVPGNKIIPRYDFQPLHEAIVEQALREGKQVPKEVLSEYPNLERPAAPSVATSIGAGIEAALRRKAEAGAVTVPAPIARAVEKTRDTITTLVKTKGVRDTMDYTKDVAGNAAMVYGQRVGNNIRGELRRAMGRTKKPNALDENALTFVREANGDRSQLGVMRSKLNASTVANPKWKNAALKAIDHADANWDRLNPIASQYEGATHAQIMAENNAGINTVERPGYVMHAQDVKNEFGFFSDVAGEGTTGFKHVRTHDTLADSIAAGVDPKSINAVTLLTQRVARGQMLINNRAWVEGLKATIDPLTRKTVITEPEVISRGQGLPPDTRAPEGYVMEIAGGRPIAILKPYAGIFRALTEPSKFSESLGWNMALKAATTGKSISLLIDTFHLGRIAFWESIIKPLSFTDPKLPLPSYKRGVLTLDYSPAELNRMAQSGEIDPAHLNDILQAQRDVNGLVKHGYNIAKISDMLHQEWMQKIPITGGFTKWLFNQFQRGAMAEVGALEVGRYRRMHPSWTEERVYREVAKDLNTRFGNLGRQGILKSRTAQDTARLLFLAPQWNEGLIRSELGAITGAVKGIASTAKEGRLSFGILPRAVGAMIVAQFAANQIINYITRGKPTWQNEEEGLGAKLSAWVPDVVGKGPGFFLHPLGLAAEVTHLLSQKYEKKGDAREAIMAFMGGRLSTLSRPLMTFLTRRDIFQRLIRPEKIWGETAKSAIPSPIGAQAVVPAIGERLGGEPKEPFVGAYQKQMMSSMGVKTDQAPSPGQRMQTLAQKFKKERGITTPGEFYGSAYTPLRDAIQRGAMKESLAEYDRLLDTVAPSGKRYTPEQIDNAMKPWTGGRLNKQTYQVTPRKAKTFTGSAAKEREFINTLTPEQKATYRRAYEDRVQFYKNFREMLKARPKATNEFGFVPLE